MSRSVPRRALWRLSIGAALAATACAPKQPDAEAGAADSLVTASSESAAAVGAATLPPDSAPVDAPAPPAPAATGAAPGAAASRPRAGEAPRPAPAPASGSRAVLPDSARAAGGTRAPTNPARLDSARRAPRIPIPTRPNDATPSIPNDPPRLEPPPAPQPPDAALARLEREARALAITSGCSGAAGCRVAPLGARACGGPREYIAYCRATTDSARLFAKLAELERAEQAYNSRSGMASVCSMVMPPAPGYAGGRCTAAAAP